MRYPPLFIPPFLITCAPHKQLILFGQAHDDYWSKTVHSALRAVAPPDSFEQGAERLKGFGAGAGTVLFFEDEDAVAQWQKNVALYADRFPQWSQHASGAAQINVWTVLEQAGLGASLQHYGNLTNKEVNKMYELPEGWKLQAELVFGEPLAPAGNKDYMDDSKRFKVVGASS